MDDTLQKALGELWLDSKIVANVTELCDEYGPRFAGSESERRARDYLVDCFGRYGLEDVRLETCGYTGWKRGDCQVELLSPRTRQLEAVSMVLAAPTPPVGIEAEVIYLNQGTKLDFNRLADQIHGKIVLVRLGSPVGSIIHRVSKYGWAHDNGAVGVIFAKEEPNQLIGTGTVAVGYREVGVLPAVEVSHETHAYLVRQLDNGPVRVRMTLGCEFVPGAETWNIVGDIQGNGESDEEIIVGAHWDGHDRADAALDNALGIFTILDTARALAALRGRLRRRIRFIGFGNEESWIVGSTNYVAQHHDEMARIALMINCDAIARFGRTHIRVSSRRDVYDYFQRQVRGHNIPISIAQSGWLPGSSDEWPFLTDGVPSIAMRGTQTAEELARGRGLDHTQADTVDKLDDVRARESAMLLAQVLVAVANEPERPGPKLPRQEIFRRLSENGAENELRAQGRWHPDSVL